MNQLVVYIVTRLLRTGQIKAGDEPTQAAFDKAYEADVTKIVMDVLKSQGLTS